MTDPQSDNPAPHAWRFNPRAFLTREWPYLLVLLLALFGVGYTSFSKTPITTYWVFLAPFIGVICVVTRWRDAANREQRLRLFGGRTGGHWSGRLLKSQEIQSSVLASRAPSTSAASPSAAPLYAVFPAGLENDPRVKSFVEFAAANIVPALAH
jgi:hypothetical protein